MSDATDILNNNQQQRRPQVMKPAIVVLFLISSLGAMSQPYTSRLGYFQVDQVLGCAPFTVTLTNTGLKPPHDCATSTCQMTFEPTVTPTESQFTYTYNTPGTFTLSVVYPSVAGNNASDDITITVLPNIPPDFEILTCSNYGVTIKITDTIYDSYLLDLGDGSPVKAIASGNTPTIQHYYAGSGTYNISLHGRKLHAADNCNSNIQAFNALLTLPAPFINTLTAVDLHTIRLDFSAVPHLDLQLQVAVNNSGTFQLAQTLYGISTTSIVGLDLSKNYYCFRLNAHDPCTGNDTPSNVICSQEFTATAISDDNQLTWVTDPGVPAFSITRNSSPLTTVSGSAYDDIKIVCNTPYCYQLFSNYADGSVSISLLQCVTSFSSKIPTVINNASAVVSTTGVNLVWLQDTAYTTTQYRVFRDQSKGTFQFLAYAPTTTISDAGYTTEGNYCYEINYTDMCKNDSPLGSIICPIRLLGTLDRTNAVHLIWNGYRGWKNGVSNYTLDKFDKSNNLLKTVSTGTDTSYVDNQLDTVNQMVSYRVTATPVSTLLPSVSNIAVFTKDANLYSPTAFTPDRNNLNDNFTVRGFFITRLELRIFNRWGQLIFSTDKNEPWDGTFNGRAQPNDTYVWTARITDTVGHNFEQHGKVVLLTR